MSFERQALDRLTARRYMEQGIVTAQRTEKRQELQKRIAQGEGETEKLNADDGTPFFIFGLTEFSDSYTI